MAYKYLFPILFVFTLIGCGGGDNNTRKLTVWHVGSEEEAQIISAVAAQKYTPTTGIKVQCESISWGESHSKYLTAIAGGVAPDIGTMGLTWGTEFGSKGQMIDLRSAFPEGLEELKKKTFESIWKAVEYRGAVYSVPFDMTLHVLYYRKDIIPTPPQTWAELTSLLKKINTNKQSLVLDWGSLEWIGFSPFLWQAGGDYYNANLTQSTLNSPEAVHALTFYADLYRNYQVPQSGEGIAQGLRSGHYPVGISGNWLINSLPADAPEIQGKWTIARLPAGPSGKRTGFIGGRSMGIFKNSKIKTDAWGFIQFLNQKEIQQQIYVEIAKSHNIYMPPNINAWELLPIEDNMKKVLVAQVKESKAPPSLLGWNDSTRFVVEAIQKSVVKGADPAVTLRAAAKAMDERIEK